MNTQNDADNQADFEALQKAIVLKCYNVCQRIAQNEWAMYKGRHIDKRFVANPHTEGMSDGAAVCALEILQEFGMEEP